MTKNLKLKIVKGDFIVCSLILCAGKCGMVCHAKQLTCTALLKQVCCHELLYLQ